MGKKGQELCERAKKKEGDGAVCSIANELFPNGFSCGGTAKSVKELESLATSYNALQAKILKTAGAFHTEMMQPAQDKLSKALDETLPKMKPPMHTVWMNVTAEPVRPGCDPKDIVANLQKQLTNSVRWEESVKGMIEEGDRILRGRSHETAQGHDETY